MTAQPLASGIAALGRGNDKMLVHMSPIEVEALQRLALKHGGKLTINPHTGLYEAGFLSKILPTIAGIGLSAMGMSPLAAGLITGGIGALASKSLKGGLLAGLGAWGGAGLGKAFAGMGEAAAAEGANVLAQSAGNTAAAAPLPDWASKAAVQDMMANESFYAPDYMGGPAPSTTPYEMPYREAMRLDAVNNNAYAGAPAGAAGQFQRMGEGVKYAIGNPSEALNKENLQYAGAAAAPFMSYDEEEAARRAEEAKRRGASGPATYHSTSFNPGSVNPNFGQPGQPYYLNRDFGPGHTTSVFPYAEGGIAGVAPPRMIRGPGDGMSDSIPATIEGRQRAALSNDEFVVPADVVSHIGNGSSEAGAKKLYAMMDRVRASRTGKKKQAPAIKAERMMPA